MKKLINALIVLGFAGTVFGMKVDESFSLMLQGQDQEAVTFQEPRSLATQFLRIKHALEERHGAAVEIPDVTPASWGLAKDVFLQRKNNAQWAVASIHCLFGKIRGRSLQEHIMLSHALHALRPAFKPHEEELFQRGLYQKTVEQIRPDVDQAIHVLRGNRYPVSGELREKIIAEIMFKKMPQAFSWSFQRLGDISAVEKSSFSQKLLIHKKDESFAVLDNDGLQEIGVQLDYPSIVCGNNISLFYSTMKPTAILEKNGIMQELDTNELGLGSIKKVFLSPDKSKMGLICEHGLIIVGRDTDEHTIFTKQATGAEDFNPYSINILWSSDSAHAAIKSRSSIVFITYDEGIKATLNFTEPIDSFAWAPDDNKCVVMVGNMISFFDSDGRIISAIGVFGLGRRARRLAWFDNNTVVVVCNDGISLIGVDGNVQRQVQPLNSYNQKDKFQKFMYSNCRFKGVMYKSSVAVVSGSEIKFFDCHLDPSKGWSPDGSRMVNYGGPKRFLCFPLDFISLGDGELKVTKQNHPFGEGKAIVWSPDSSNVAIVTNGAVGLYDGAGLYKKTLFTQNQLVEWSPDSKILVLRERELLFLVGSDGALLSSIVIPSLHIGDLYQVQWAPDGTHMCMKCSNGVAFIDRGGNVVRVISQEELGLGSLKKTEWVPAYNRFVIFCKEGIAFIEDDATIKRIETQGLQNDVIRAIHMAGNSIVIENFFEIGIIKPNLNQEFKDKSLAEVVDMVNPQQ